MVKKCEICSKLLRGYKPRRNIHINIHNKPIIHFFCSNECKCQWIYEIQRFNKYMNALKGNTIIIGVNNYD